ncbi:hypothetical protein CcCBS67573_g07162 [Chytriomyces confervae]|uniref:t-SNARE coiled-coil homology domain-containing protein n=1 Tax=Chytriomyces confervae TaxID=246404 RepID=A0A507EWM6_9FUNG|nr:hypothetical protein CcCBS67573_g07162 [Chytriomyces confervae]
MSSNNRNRYNNGGAGSSSSNNNNNNNMMDDQAASLLESQNDESCARRALEVFLVHCGDESGRSSNRHRHPLSKCSKSHPTFRTKTLSFYTRRPYQIISIDLHDNVNDQNRFLEDMSHSFNQVGDGLKTSAKRMQTMLKTPHGQQTCTMAVLVVVLLLSVWALWAKWSK